MIILLELFEVRYFKLVYYQMDGINNYMCTIVMTHPITSMLFRWIQVLITTRYLNFNLQSEPPKEELKIVFMTLKVKGGTLSRNLCSQDKSQRFESNLSLDHKLQEILTFKYSSQYSEIQINILLLILPKSVFRLVLLFFFQLFGLLYFQMH